MHVLGLDGAYPLTKGKKRPVLIAIDLGIGQPMAIEQIDEFTPQSVRRFVEPLVERLGVSVIVADDLVSFRTRAGKLGLEHQVCQFHVRSWVGRTLHELKESIPEEWLWVLEEITRQLADLPLAGSRRLFEIWKQISIRRS